MPICMSHFPPSFTDRLRNHRERAESGVLWSETLRPMDSDCYLHRIVVHDGKTKMMARVDGQVRYFSKCPHCGEEA